MNNPAAFDVFSCKLDGINLIEASAGTGKTWNICGLYMRLLLECDLEVQQILVVTFTNAATAELRARIRTQIVDMLAYLRDDTQSAADDPFVPKMIQAVEEHTHKSRGELAAVLDKALQYFDEAAIFTIHGFCQRALADASFSAGLPLALELVTDDREIALEVVQDFWRRHIASDSCPPLLAAYLLDIKDTPEKYADLLARSLKKPLAQCFWPEALSEPAVAIDDSQLLNAFEVTRQTWEQERDDIHALFKHSSQALSQSSHKAASIDKSVAGWDSYFSAGVPLATTDADRKLDLLSQSRLEKATKKNQQTPRHPFFEQAQLVLDEAAAITDALRLDRLRLVRDLIDSGASDLRRRKRERRVISFDDMLFNLYDALTGGAHPDLASSLRQRFPVALIDEFQDTDPLQFAIFSRIYGDGATPSFLVGDPKQAIYSFRNADLYSYLQARQSASAEYTLADNQRSSKGLIEVLNGLFGANQSAFMLQGLDYHAVNVGAKKRKSFFDHTAPRADLQVWMLPEAEPLTKADAARSSARASAAEIARLIEEAGSGKILIDERPLRAGDIAVLVRTHAQGSLVKRELAALNVGSVELSQASVFQTIDAEEVERVLIAINQPSREALLRAALATELLGCDATRIADITSDEAQLMDYLERFSGYRDLWLRQGVGVMYRRLLVDEGVSARMLRRPDGERRLTNLLHLGEQIHQAAASHKSPDALLRWLATQRREGSADEVAQLRLDSDRNLVQIITIHKAKGLEFPVVFCPFLWEAKTQFGGAKPEGREYHDDDGTAIIDLRDEKELGSDEARIKAQIDLESSAEMLRLIYVALTRAVYRCYLIAGTYASGRGGSTTASSRSLLNWLVAGNGEMPASWAAGRRTSADISAAWEKLSNGLTPHLQLAPLPADRGRPVVRVGPAAETLSAMSPPTMIAPTWRFGSFSSLARDADSERAATDHDARITQAMTSVGAAPPAIAHDDILRFPRGPDAGECLHEIFERIDFTDASDWSEVIDTSLLGYPQLQTAERDEESPALLARMAAQMLASVTHATLPDGIVLTTIPRTRRLTELAFSLPSPRVSAAALNFALKASGYDVPRLSFHDLEGYLKGFIDLVFEHGGRYYIVDWKSNHLGYTAPDYAPDALGIAMADHRYHLQYLLYALAVHRYLKHRIPNYDYDMHFGGVLYLFVRGVRPEWRNADGSPAGVYFDRPTAATIARLDALFAKEREQVPA